MKVTRRMVSMMRLYWPNESDPSIIDGTWKLPPVHKGAEGHRRRALALERLRHGAGSGGGLRRCFATAASLATLLALAAAPDARADSSTIGATVTSDRQQGDLGVPNSAKVKILAAHTFGSGIIVGGSTEYSNTADSDAATVNVEATVGARLPLTDILSLAGSVGLGARLQVSGSGDDFAYYVLRASADWKLSETVTWNAVAFRYRDAFELDQDYLTPQVASGLTVKVDEHNAVSGKVQYNWKDWDPDTIGFELGFSHSF